VRRAVRTAFAQVQLNTGVESAKTAIALFYVLYLEDLLGLRDDVFPGVLLLSRRRWSGFPVDFAIGFGPGLSAMNALLFDLRKLACSYLYGDSVHSDTM
jgi:hypothetical protein